MGEERIELEKLTIVLFQSLAVLFSAYIVSLFKNAEYTPQSIAILYLLISCILLYFTSAIWPTVFIQEVIWMSCYKY